MQGSKSYSPSEGVGESPLTSAGQSLKKRGENESEVLKVKLAPSTKKKQQNQRKTTAEKDPGGGGETIRGETCQYTPVTRRLGPQTTRDLKTQKKGGMGKNNRMGVGAENDGEGLIQRERIRGLSR